MNLGNPNFVGYNLDAKLYDWEMENYELQARECWTIQSLSKKKTRQCFSVSIIPKIFERKVREYPSLKLMKQETSS